MIKYIFHIELLNILCEQLCSVTNETFERRMKLIKVLRVENWKVLKPRKKDVSSCLILMKIFSKIKEISMLFNDAMGFSVLCFFISVILNVSTIGVLVLWILDDPELTKNTSILGLLAGTSFLIVQVTNIACLCRRNENVMSEFNHILDRVRSEYNNELTEDQAEVLEMLSMNVTALKIQFSLGDFETINLNVIIGVNLKF